MAVLASVTASAGFNSPLIRWILIAGNAEGAEQLLVGDAEIAVGMVRRNAAFIGPEEMDMLEGNVGGDGVFGRRRQRKRWQCARRESPP